MARLKASSGAFTIAASLPATCASGFSADMYLVEVSAPSKSVCVGWPVVVSNRSASTATGTVPSLVSFACSSASALYARGVFSRRASVSKSPAAPVENSQWKYTGSVTSPAAGEAQAG